jgi:hypothetical protein
MSSLPESEGGPELGGVFVDQPTKRLAEVASCWWEVRLETVERGREAMLDAVQPIIDVLKFDAKAFEHPSGSLGVTEDVLDGIKIGGLCSCFGEVLFQVAFRDLCLVHGQDSEAHTCVEEVGQPLGSVLDWVVGILGHLITVLVHGAFPPDYCISAWSVPTGSHDGVPRCTRFER